MKKTIKLDKSGYPVAATANDKVCAHRKRLDLYGYGCSHNCPYCYARNIYTMSGREYHWDPNNPKVADLAEMRELIRRYKPGEVVRLGGMTDCLQQSEVVHRRTLQAIKWLNQQRVHYLIVTKSDLIATDEYVNVLDQKLAHIQISISMTNDALASQYEHCALPSQRIAAVEKLSALGYDTTLRLSPYDPGLVDYNIINAVKCSKLLVGFYFVAPKMKWQFPVVDYAKYTYQDGYYCHLPLAYKIEALKPFAGNFEEISVCDDCPAHHKYWQTQFNPNPTDCCNLRIPAITADPLF